MTEDIDVNPEPPRDPWAYLNELRHQVAKLEKELSEWRLLLLWGGNPESVAAFIRGQQERIHVTQDMEHEIAMLKRELKNHDKLWRERDRARMALELIAAPMRSDGTYNRDRAECGRIAREALK